MRAYALDTIIRYLRNPMKVGVYNEKLTVDLSGVHNYLEGLMKKQK